jgi:CheY-like chemotaxis protein
MLSHAAVLVEQTRRQRKRPPRSRWSLRRRGNRIDGCELLMLDVHMPELDGFQVIRAIREREQPMGRQLPVLAVTAKRIVTAAWTLEWMPISQSLSTRQASWPP